MILTSQDLLFLCSQAILAAEKAAGIIQRHYKNQIEVHFKEGGESLASQVVTEVDLLAQEAILDILLPTCEKFDLALLTEEREDDLERLEKDYFWCVDPLDGTLPFTEGRSGFAVSIALVSKSGTPYLGVVLEPLQQNLYHAIRGQGAFLNYASWVSSKSNSVLTWVMDRSFLQKPNFDVLYQEIKALALEMGYQDLSLIHHGGAAMNACWVLENTPACYFKLPKLQEGGGSLWDYAATACLFAEIECAATDIFGNALHLNREESTFMNHRGVLFASDNVLQRKIRELCEDLTSKG